MWRIYPRRCNRRKYFPRCKVHILQPHFSFSFFLLFLPSTVKQGWRAPIAALCGYASHEELCTVQKEQLLSLGRWGLPSEIKEWKFATSIQASIIHVKYPPELVSLLLLHKWHRASLDLRLPVVGDVSPAKIFLGPFSCSLTFFWRLFQRLTLSFAIQRHFDEAQKCSFCLANCDVKPLILNLMVFN